ncbi:MAG: rRNA pseudouridine synthase [Bacilli bacterium]|nr:rRNA pseudouridine synthase [Bacilli bacterium]
MEERLQKKIAASGLCSRRKAEELITAGKVLVNGKIVTEMGIKVSNKDEIMVDGKLINNTDKLYYLLYKPEKVISSTKDEHNRKTVVDLIDCTNEKIYPIGRLDYDTTGIILLTNDGALTDILAHPKNMVPKTYVAKINTILTKDEIYQIKNGIKIDNRKVEVLYFKVRKVNKENRVSTIEITISEGRNHIVKNIFLSLGHKVLKLKRTTYGFLDLSGLKKGEYRSLTIKEVKTLYAYKNNKIKKV